MLFFVMFPVVFDRRPARFPVGSRSLTFRVTYHIWELEFCFYVETRLTGVRGVGLLQDNVVVCRLCIRTLSVDVSAFSDVYRYIDNPRPPICSNVCLVCLTIGQFFRQRGIPCHLARRVYMSLLPVSNRVRRSAELVD